MLRRDVHASAVSRPRRRRVQGLVLLFAVVAVLLTGSLQVLSDGAPHDWRVVYDGYGPGFTVLPESDGQVVELEPNSSRAMARTHAVLAVSAIRRTDFALDLRMRTVEQLRRGNAPNPWEVGWVIWRHTDSDHFYYLALKPNGWELGKRDPAYRGGQRFLATGATPTFPVGERWHTVRVIADGPRCNVFVDGQELAEIVDTERPYLAGQIGMYTEDARAQFAGIVLDPRPSSDAPE